MTNSPRFHNLLLTISQLPVLGKLFLRSPWAIHLMTPIRIESQSKRPRR